MTQALEAAQKELRALERIEHRAHDRDDDADDADEGDEEDEEEAESEHEVRVKLEPGVKKAQLPSSVAKWKAQAQQAQVQAEGSGSVPKAQAQVQAEGSGSKRPRSQSDVVCLPCEVANSPCQWKTSVSGAGTCRRCQEKKVKCKKTDSEDEPAAEPEPKRLRKISSASTAASVVEVESLREASIAALGSPPPVPPAAYEGPPPLHDRGQQFPGLVANMSGAFGAKGDNLWGNFLNVASNSQLQVDGSLRALLAVQQDLAAEARRTSIELASIAQSLAIVAGSAVGQHLPGTREELLIAGLGHRASAEPEASVAPPKDLSAALNPDGDQHAQGAGGPNAPAQTPPPA